MINKRCRTNEHEWNFLKWVKKDVVACFYCIHCLMYDLKISDAILTWKNIKKYYKIKLNKNQLNKHGRK